MVQTIEPVVVKRVIRAKREQAFRAFTEAARIASWLAGPGETCSVEAFDACEGGVFRLDFRAADTRFAIEGRFLEIVPAERIAMTWRRTGNNGDPAESRVTVTFADAVDGTEVIVRHEGLETEEAAEAAFQSWTERLIRYGSNVFASSMMEEYSVNTTASPTGMAGKILEARKATQLAIARFNDTFGSTPDDKVDHRPSETCRTALKIAAHVAVANEHFASVLRGEPQEHSDFPSIVAAQLAKEAILNSREEVERRLSASNDAILDALDKVDPSVVEANPQLGFYVSAPAYHIANHAAQIDYLQTTWGDHENHFGH